MLTTIRDRMNALIASGATLEQVVAAQPTSDWASVSRGSSAFFLKLSYYGSIVTSCLEETPP
jgi:hypothetical protein